MTASRERLNAAAWLLLDAAGAADPGVRLHCLAAVDLLRTAGADPRRPERSSVTLSSATSDTATLKVAIRSGCSQLAGLPPDVFALAPVADAAAHARRALELLDGV